VYTGQPALELEDFVGAKFKCLHALADGNQYIRIREKMLEFSSTLLSALSPYLEYTTAYLNTDVATNLK